MGFSGAVKLADLNDFIAPSQACVVNLESLKDRQAPSDFLASQQEDEVALQPSVSRKGWSQTLPVKTAADPIKISLQDCLACSGCVTSAETVLLEHQSTEEFVAKLRHLGTAVVVTLSQQSVASLAVAHGLAPNEAARKLASFFKGMGAKAVLDAGLGRELSLLETAAEFVERYKAAQTESPAEGEAPPDTERRSSHATAGSSGREHVPSHSKRHCNSSEEGLPMMASACPGWVCYAEKTHASYALPHISTAKSPQAVMGSLLKQFWAKEAAIDPKDIYHCSVMPCYDKKLEASRDDFNIPGTSIPETDSVLTTVEIQQLLDLSGLDLNSLPGTNLDSLLPGQQQSSLLGVSGGSGGYMEYIYRQAAVELFGLPIPAGRLPMKVLRNTDFQETSIEVNGVPVLKFALVYGFRNIQTLLRKVKQGLSQYAYVEVMACPSGCVNGGGQMKAAATESARDVISKVDSAYHHPEIARSCPATSAAAQEIYRAWIGGTPYSDAAKKVLHTQYHKRDKSITATVRDW